jgi:predicted MarR family transcription regulator
MIAKLQLQLMNVLAPGYKNDDSYDMHYLRQCVPGDRITIWQSLQTLQKYGLVRSYKKDRKCWYKATLNGAKALEHMRALHKLTTTTITTVR